MEEEAPMPGNVRPVTDERDGLLFEFRQPVEGTGVMLAEVGQGHLRTGFRTE